MTPNHVAARQSEVDETPDTRVVAVRDGRQTVTLVSLNRHLDADLETGVLPAIEKVVSMGIADPDRVGVMGESYGGYSTAGLIARTDRFKAAVAVGLFDLVASYGRLDRRYRYRDALATHSAYLGPYSAESQQLRMGLPLWRDPDRYVRNRPIVFADRITTPLLLMHGSVDSVPISHSEELFTALYRQRKRAEFVQYVGEAVRTIRGEP